MKKRFQKNVSSVLKTNIIIVRRYLDFRGWIFGTNIYCGQWKLWDQFIHVGEMFKSLHPLNPMWQVHFKRQQKCPCSSMGKGCLECQLVFQSSSPMYCDPSLPPNQISLCLLQVFFLCFPLTVFRSEYLKKAGVMWVYKDQIYLRKKNLQRWGGQVLHMENILEGFIS